MRRNVPQRRNTNMSSGEGPLLTEHLRNLDMELELLKRKREMIEEQQQLYTRQHRINKLEQYEQSSSYRPQFGTKRDFSNLYNDTPEYGGQHSRKRHAGPVWEHEVQSNMSASKKKAIQPLLNTRLGSRPGQQGSTAMFGSGSARYQKPRPNTSHNSKPKKNPAPLMSVSTSIGQKLMRRPAQNNKTSKPTQKNLTKVTKPKTQPAPNKLAAQPVSRRANLVAEATRSLAAFDEPLVLREDRVPTQQMTGRLEWALGAIMKEIKETYAANEPYTSVFASSGLQRLMKQTVRERIRAIMLGKVVGSSLEIKEKYRMEYPEDTDIDILNIAMDTVGIKHEGKSKAKVVKKEPKPIKTPPKNVSSMVKIRSATMDLSEDADLYFKINMNNLMTFKLDEIFNKLKEVYEKGETDGIANQKPTLNINIDNSKEDAKENQEAAKQDQEGAKQNSEIAKPDQEDVKPNQEYAKQGQEDTTDEQEDEKQNQEDAKQDRESVKQEENGEKQEQEGTNQDQESAKQIQENIKQEPNDESKAQKRLSSAEIARIITIKRMLPRLLRKYTPVIMKILDEDKEYQTAKAEILAKTNEMNTKKEVNQQTEIKEQPAEKPKPAHNLLHFVKIKARPSLPKKNVMREFLNNFNTKSIKKHRSIHNLLFVGFSEKSDYENILAVNGTSIGRFVLEIAPSDRNGAKNNPETENDKLDDSEEKIFTPEIDNQISDLLTSIRQADEESKDDENESSVEKTDKSENAEPINNSEDNQEEENEVQEKHTIDNDKDAVVIIEDNEEATGYVDLTDTDTQDTMENTEENPENGEEDMIVSEDTNVSEDKVEESDEMNDKVTEMKKEAKESGNQTTARVTRSSTATPSTIKTRRASRLAQN